MRGAVPSHIRASVTAACMFLEVSSQTIRRRFDRCCPSSSVAARSHPFPTGRPASPSLMRPWWEATSWEPARLPLPRLPALSMPAIILLVTFVIVSAGHPAGSFLPASAAKVRAPTNPRPIISRKNVHYRLRALPYLFLSFALIFWWKTIFCKSRPQQINFWRN